MTTTIALLHPGEMGAQVGACLVDRGHRVLWVSAGRGEATRERARAAGLVETSSLATALTEADVALSVCPPHGALDVAREVADAGFQGIYVDANAIAPATSQAVAATVTAAGARFVDGGIIGLPPVAGASTRLYLTGEAASQVAALFAGSHLKAVVLEGEVGAASALKICYAAWTKGATAMLADIRALAASAGVEQALLDEWNSSQPGLAERSVMVTGQARKAWRWIVEMEEIAASFRAAGLPDGFHLGAADVYRRLEGFKDASAPVPLETVVQALRGRE